MKVIKKVMQWFLNLFKPKLKILEFKLLTQ